MTGADQARGPAPEFSRLIPVEPGMGSGEAATTFEISPTPAEREALARRFGLISLDALAARGRLEVFARGRRARLTATLQADVVQACVVTLAPVPAHVEETFSVDYDRAAASPEGEVLVDPDAADPPDPLPEAGVDVGEAVAEHFGLALDPYPRAPGAELGPGAADQDGAARASVFEALRKLRKS